MAHGLSVMWKTVSNYCNMACDYCYFDGSAGHGGKKPRIDQELLETFIRDYMAGSGGKASFVWQGGEPLLAGLDFFREVVRLQALHAPPGTVIGNSVQTNGTLIDEEWARFFRQYNVFVGVSLDGPRDIHDARRPFGSGAGSFDAAMRGIAWLRRYGVEFNVLTVVHRGNVREAARLMDFYEREGFTHVQFIPCMSFKARDAEADGLYEITPAEYGDFLCEAFDRWWNDGRPRLSVRFFDNVLARYLGREAESCVQRPTCARTLILDGNGDAYPCDFYMNREYRLGNVGEQSIGEIVDHPAYRRFLTLKSELPDDCRACEYFGLCHGGCPRNRGWSGGRAVRPDYFCAAYRRIFAHAHDRLVALAAAIRADWKRELLARGGTLPGRNEPCFCGSGLKYKKCCEGA